MASTDGPNTAAFTSPVCPASTFDVRLVRSHNLAVRSALADSRKRPSALNAADFTAPVCPVSVPDSPLPSSRSRIVWSTPAPARVRPSGLKASAPVEPGAVRQPYGMGGVGQVPQQRRPVRADHQRASPSGLSAAERAFAGTVASARGWCGSAASVNATVPSALPWRAAARPGSSAAATTPSRWPVSRVAYGVPNALSRLPRVTSLPDSR